MQNKLLLKIILLAGITSLLISCQKEDTPVIYDENYRTELLNERKENDSLLQYDPHSPFNVDTTIEFSSLNYFEPDQRFVFKSKLFKYETPDTVFILGTRGEYRIAIPVGYLAFSFDGKEYKINVYKSFGRNMEEYYSIWFTDKTTGYETYGVGRYLVFEFNENAEFEYTLDFNRAYNPYCAYSPKFTCPIPREEDHLDLAIRAGEINFH
jgi:uncharacterized protein (DUF1684 family)